MLATNEEFLGCERNGAVVPTTTCGAMLNTAFDARPLPRLVLYWGPTVQSGHGNGTADQSDDGGCRVRGR